MATFPNWLPLNDAVLKELEPFKIAMDNEECRGSKHPDEVSKEEMQRVYALEAQLAAAAERGNDTEVARLEAAIDGILLQPVVSEEVA